MSELEGQVASYVLGELNSTCEHSKSAGYRVQPWSGRQQTCKCVDVIIALCLLSFLCSLSAETELCPNC